MGYYPPRVLVAEAKRSGVEILPIDINHSTGEYTVEDGAIRISLRQLKGMSEEALKSILAAREDREFVSLMDFIMRTEINRPIVENLIKVRAFDSFDNREDLLHDLARIIEARQMVGKGTRPLFADMKPEHAAATVFSDRRINMISERSLLSLSLSAHPFDFLALGEGFIRMIDLRKMATGQRVKIAGSVIRYQTSPTRNGNRVVYVIMEDGTGIADVTVFSDVQKKYGDVLFKEGWLIVEGKVQRRGPKAMSIIAEKILPLSVSTS
ncbi:DNA polymerase III subunit alpha [subsurface metagenome]